MLVKFNNNNTEKVRSYPTKIGQIPDDFFDFEFKYKFLRGFITFVLSTKELRTLLTLICL